MRDDSVKVIYFGFIITQSNRKNIEYLINWLQKIRLEQLLFE